MSATTIDGVIDQLEDIIDSCIRTESRLGYFAALYKRMTLAVKAGIQRGAFQDAARIEKVPVEWGGSWPRFRDGPHFQLPWAKYPG